jgi:SagB-type dehydrogenase family enzyme
MLVCAPQREDAPMLDTQAAILLPAPHAAGSVSVEQALGLRRSLREFRTAPLTLGETSQLLWAAQGQTAEDGSRTAPSAGALYPLEVFLVAGRVAGLAPGVYRYKPDGHLLEPVIEGDHRRALSDAALGQGCVRSAPAALLVAAVPERTARKYGRRAERYVYIEVGAAVQNVALQAVALGLGTVVVGAFDDAAVARVVRLLPEQRPLAILPVGHE